MTHDNVANRRRGWARRHRCEAGLKLEALSRSLCARVGAVSTWIRLKVFRRCCWQAWQFYLVLPSFILNLLRHTALTTALTQEADKCGFGQGELRGMIGNLG